MAENITRNSGRSKDVKSDRGGAPSESGPFVGVVKNNVDPTRSGRLQVFITELAAGADAGDSSTWRTVSYMSPFYGVTQNTGSGASSGEYVGNRHSYGMWFTPPDIETRVLCFFAGGDPNQGYYLGCIPEPGLTHMVPAIGAVTKAKRDNATQEQLFGGAPRLPVAEINDKNSGIVDDPRYHDKEKPVHSYTAGILFQQGLIGDWIRGPIGSSSQRESPSAVYGISTPGRAIYEAGLSEADIKKKLQAGSIKPHDVKVLGRRGGHSFVMDDGDLEGSDALIRIRTSRGHQLLMSDDGDCFHFIHANGQAWIEMGKEGVIDMYSSNSINFRTQGEMNFHADKSMNFYAGENFKLHAAKEVQLESGEKFNVVAAADLTLHSSAKVGVLANGALALKSDATVGIGAAGTLSVLGSRINLNSGGAATVAPPKPIVKTTLADTEFSKEKGWEVKPTKLKSIVSRAPTHEPYQEHSKGVDVKVVLAAGGSTPKPQPSPTVAAKLQQAAALPAKNPISVADFANTVKAAGSSVGPIQGDQLAGMMAQKAKDIGQAVTAVTAAGIGKFAIKPEDLEKLGYLKPGTVDMIKQVGGDVKGILDTANRWTLKGGIDNIGQLLSSEKIQATIEKEATKAVYKALEESGVLQGIEEVKQVVGLVNAALTNGPQMVADWANGKINEATAKITALVSQGQKAIDFVTNKLPEAMAAAQAKLGAVATSTRQGIDETVNAVIGNGKVPAPIFQVDASSLDALGNSLKGFTKQANAYLDNVKKVADQLKGAAGQATGIVNDVKSTVDNAAGQVTGIVNDVKSTVDKAANLSGNLFK